LQALRAPWQPKEKLKKENKLCWEAFRHQKDGDLNAEASVEALLPVEETEGSTIEL